MVWILQVQHRFQGLHIPFWWDSFSEQTVGRLPWKICQHSTRPSIWMPMVILRWKLRRFFSNITPEVGMGILPEMIWQFHDQVLSDQFLWISFQRCPFSWRYSRSMFLRTKIYTKSCPPKKNPNKPWQVHCVSRFCCKLDVVCLFYMKKTYGCFLKWWVSPTTMGFPTKNDQHLRCVLGVPPFKETAI